MQLKVPPRGDLGDETENKIPQNERTRQKYVLRSNSTNTKES